MLKVHGLQVFQCSGVEHFTRWNGEGVWVHGAIIVRSFARSVRQLVLALQAYVVRRDQGKTIIAGYPWFLDWGRDSLICARGLLAAGMAKEVRELLITFGHFAQGGTIPNSIPVTTVIVATKASAAPSRPIVK